jgi:thymidine phosphorylase
MNSTVEAVPSAILGTPHVLRVRRMGIDTYQEPVVYMRSDCAVCRSEGFASQSRVRVATSSAAIVATLNVVAGDIVDDGEIGLSEIAWRRLEAQEGELAMVSHAEPVDSFRHVRAKLYGQRLAAEHFQGIVDDIAVNRYTDVQLSAFISACTLGRLDLDEIVSLTRAMVDAGERLSWSFPRVMDKHCVGGLPGNRTTPIVVPIVAACGVPIPKTSSRAITSPAGTADAMETLAPVDLDLAAMRRVVEQEGGCIVWGGAVELSPADDVLIRVERALDVDSDAQLIASVLSKKLAAGATHVVIDMPVGETAKVRSLDAADELGAQLRAVGRHLDLEVAVEVTDGREPVGRGIGPALEAHDVLAVLQRAEAAPPDLRDRATRLAGRLLEIAGVSAPGQGQAKAIEVIDTGLAWRKFEAICRAQGGLREPPSASHRQVISGTRDGVVTRIDNRRLARVAKLAGAPSARAAGVELAVRLGQAVSKGDPLYTVHAETPGELAYALHYLSAQPDVLTIGGAR